MNNILLQNTRFWTPEQAEAFHKACSTLYETVWLPLQVPDWSVWRDALQHAALDSRQAVVSLGSFFFLTLRPLVVLLLMMLQATARVVWKYVLVQGISQQGVQFLTAAVKGLVRHQQSLTRKQVAVEVGGLVGAVVVYQISKVLQRQTYFRRFAAYVRRLYNRVVSSYQQRKRAVRQFYDRSVQKIATTSLRAAVMTPHLVLAAAAVALKVLLPRFVTWMACETALLSFCNGWYPLLATILLLHDKKLYQHSRQAAAAVAAAQFKTPPSKRNTKRRSPKSSRKGVASPFPRTTPPLSSRRRLSSLIPGYQVADTEEDEEASLQAREEYWINFWVVSAACQAFKQFLALVPIAGSVVSRLGGPALKQLELCFYLWIYVVPHLLPNLANAPEGRPLVVLAPRARKFSTSVFDAMNVFPDAWWQAWPVRWTGLLLDAAVVTGLVTRPTADAGRDGVARGQSYLVPMGTLLMPRMISSFGVLFVQYCLPVQKSTTAQRDALLRYWVWHCIVSATMSRLSGILWWIPLSQAGIFVLYLALGVRDGMVERWFTTLTEDLEAFGLLPQPQLQEQQQQRSVDQTWSARAIRMVLKSLPSAEDDKWQEKEQQDDQYEPADQDEVKESTIVIEAEDEVSTEPDDALNFEDDDQYVADEPDDAVPGKENCDGRPAVSSKAAMRRSTRQQRRTSQ